MLPINTPRTMIEYRNNDRPGDSSDVKSLLETIDQLYQVSCSVLNDHTQTSLRVSIAIEAQMLLSKLRVMNRRWKIHLPFKEASQVDFFLWSERIAAIGHEMTGTADAETPRQFSRYCPSKHFLLDLYSVIDGQDGEKHQTYYEDTDVNRFVEQQELMRAVVSDDWRGYVTRVSDKSVEDLASRAEADIVLSYDGQFVQDICCKVLEDLSEELYSLNQRLTMPISRKEFIHCNFIFISSYCKKSSFVYNVGKIGTGKACCTMCNIFKVYITVEFYILCVDA